MAISAGWLSDAFGQLPSRPLPAFGAAAWEVRLENIPGESIESWKGTLEAISPGYSRKWLAYAIAADRGDNIDGLEDPLEHSFLGIKDGARTLLIPEGMVLVGSGGAGAVRVCEGDTILRFPGSVLAEQRLRGFSPEDASQPVSVCIRTVGLYSIHKLHPIHAASVSRLVSDFRLPDEDWSEEERIASAVWMERLRQASIDYVLIERVDPVFGAIQMVVPVRASLISTRASSYIERHIDNFAALPIEPNDRVTCVDSATLAMIWLPWQNRLKTPGASPSDVVLPKCVIKKHAVR